MVSCCGLISRKEMNFVVLLLRLWLVGFGRVSRLSRVSMVRVNVRIRVRFSFNDRVGIKLPAVQ